MLKGFKDFIMRGNLVELAVAVIIATAFGAVVTAFTDLLMSIISRVLGGQPNFDDVAIGGVVIGVFLTAVFSFLLVAFVVYFFVITPYNKLEERRASGEEEPTAPAADIALLTEIRDLLQQQQRDSST